LDNKINSPSSSLEEGKLSYEWASARMIALERSISKLESEQPLQNLTIGVCLHITKETSVLVRGLQRLGASVSLCASNPLSTQDEIVSYLSSVGVDVHAKRGQTDDEYFESLRKVLDSKPDIILDDGADAHVMVHTENKYSSNLIGGTEETTTGIVRLRALEQEGNMKYPIIACNDAYSKFLFDNRYGTGQSSLDGVLRATGLLIAGKRLVVCGYGWVGKGVAKRAKGFDAHVIVTEVDPFKALEAHLDGYEVMPIDKAASIGDIFITATGMTSIIRGEHISSMNDGSILANVGHFDKEIDVKFLENNSKDKSKVRPHVDRYLLNNDKNVFLIAEGRIANLIAAEGHPPEVMMMSFSDQLLSAVYLAKNSKSLERKLIRVPEDIDREVAFNALYASGISIDTLTGEQLKYQNSWKL
jgi:adenosylhomocysteinase